MFKKVTTSAKVTDAEVKDYYDSHREVYTTPQTRVVRHILVAAKDKALADKLYGELKGGRPTSRRSRRSTRSTRARSPRAAS